METRIASVAQEMSLWSDYSEATQERNRQWLLQLRAKASNIPNGFIKKITWDAEGGYPEHAWGFVQYTVRPYIPGYGCDGTTDNNIHFVAATLAGRCGLDYGEIYRSAYPDSCEHVPDWLQWLQKDQTIREETVIPQTAEENDWILALGDLYEVNNRSLVCELASHLKVRFPAVHRWHDRYDVLRSRP